MLAAQQRGQIAGAVHKHNSKGALLADLAAEFAPFGARRPRAIVIGALGRVGTGRPTSAPRWTCP